MTQALLLAALLAASAAAPRGPAGIPKSFDASGPDRAAIETVLHNYTTAVSTQNEPLFESLLLNRDIPFSGVDQAVKADGRPHGTENYEDFRQGVFHGARFTQRFQDVHIQQDGPLAQASVVFVNTGANGSGWGWKILQLLKVGGRWKIASEFYTNH